MVGLIEICNCHYILIHYYLFFCFRECNDFIDYYHIYFYNVLMFMWIRMLSSNREFHISLCVPMQIDTDIFRTT